MLQAGQGRRRQRSGCRRPDPRRQRPDRRGGDHPGIVAGLTRCLQRGDRAVSRQPGEQDDGQRDRDSGAASLGLQDPGERGSDVRTGGRLPGAVQRTGHGTRGGAVAAHARGAGRARGAGLGCRRPGRGGARCGGRRSRLGRLGAECPSGVHLVLHGFDGPAESEPLLLRGGGKSAAVRAVPRAGGCRGRRGGQPLALPGALRAGGAVEARQAGVRAGDESRPGTRLGAQRRLELVEIKSEGLRGDGSPLELGQEREVCDYGRLAGQKRSVLPGQRTLPALELRPAGQPGRGDRLDAVEPGLRAAGRRGTRDSPEDEAAEGMSYARRLDDRRIRRDNGARADLTPPRPTSPYS